MASADILIRWASDTTAAVRDMKRMDRALGQSMTKTERWRNRISTASTVAAGALAAMVPAAMMVVNAASDQEQAIGALNAVFKGYAGEMRKAADAANRLGLSTTEYAGFAARLGSQLRNAGFSMDATTTQTQKLIEAGADMAAMFGGTTTQAVEALNSVLKGEYERIDNYGMSLKAAEVKAYAMANGLDLTSAALELVGKKMKKSGITGAAAREYDTFAASTQRLKGAWTDFMAAVGESGKGKGTVSVIEELTRALRKLTKWIKENPDTFNNIAKGIIGVTIALASLKGVLTVITLLRDFLKVVGKIAKLPFVEIGLAIVTLKDQFDGFSLSIDGVVSGFKDLLTLDVGEIENMPGAKILDWLTEKAKVAWEWIEKLTYSLNSKLPSWLRINDATGVGGKMASAPTVRTSTFAPATPTTTPAVSVFVAGERRRAVTRVEPAWAPHLSMGVI